MKYLVLVILFIFVATFIFPQQNELTLEQLDELFDSQITIIDYLYDKKGKIEVEPQPLSTKWRAYQGEKWLSERKYFLITGHELEAKQASKYHLGSIPLIISSPIACYLGMLLTKSIYEWEEKQDKEYKEDEYGLTIVSFIWTLGMSFLLLRSGVSRLANTRFPYSKAQVIMNEYNEKLLEEIKEK